MHRFLLSVAAATSILAVGSLVPNRAEATPLGVPLAVDGIDPVKKVAICFYADGWNGPGLYECGYRHRRGEGWHGRREERREEGREYREDRREHRREDDRDRDHQIRLPPIPR